MKKFVVVLLFIVLPLQAASRLPVREKHAMVASVDSIASRVGADVMKRGGNAVDAAVAVALTLAVTWPEAGNLGGGGFILLRKADGTEEAIDYRERAPLAATRDMYLDASGNIIKDASLVGYKAPGVPGTVAGLALAHKRHGKLPWADLVEPAHKLAAEGFPVSQYLARSLAGKRTMERMQKFPESWRIFERNGHPYEAGETFVQPELAATLARIQKDPSDFYRGETARLIVADMQAHGGSLTSEDLARYQPTVRTPLHGTYRGFEIITMPPPSSGGVALIEMLNMLEPYDLQSMGWHSSQEVHTLVEVMRRAYADRAKFLGDTDFVAVPVKGLMTRAYAEQRRKDIDAAHASDSKAVASGEPARYESPETTHFTIIDADGSVVASTYTLNESYGSAVTTPGAGFLLNDEMDDFTSKPGVPNAYGLIQGEANAIAPQKRPLSSMTPTIVMKDGKVLFAVGSPGGSTIINTVLQVIVNVIDFGMNIQEAIDSPRFHHQWLPDKITWEPFEFSRDTSGALAKMGHIFQDRPEFIGDAHAIGVDPQNGMRLGASDPRRGGAAIGW
ncbi:MAG TPA: gamma-glutamyltransferase [Thermoanaerobaculia bacterium]|nr:gamma-glutamyltransferase [Thermoanaerobaculia bacterium]